MIKAVIFDFGQTLVDSADGFRTAEKELQQKAFDALGLSDREEFLRVYRGIRAAFHARSHFSRKAILEEIFLYYGQNNDPDLMVQWETEYWERIKLMTRVFPEAEEVLNALGAYGYHLALITNTQGQKQEGNHRLGNYPELERFFELIIVAGERGIPPKPDPTPFRLCLEKLGLPAQETAYVGDDWQIDICGSETIGMHPVWLQHHTLRRKWPVVETAAPVIHSLERLLNIEKLLKEAKK
jgi:HAD superfamily hydrolase (TIGR01549 family)